MLEGIELLRVKRGDESVKFAEIADHMVDFEKLYPDETETIHRFAAFLARVEEADHDHDGGSGATDVGES